ncbi:MAG: hypothetical protein CMJ75_08930 [Planctomycetaceae bacterium]|nr:hypothetical protein [Planctomycetaceae bacterium]
MRSFVWLALSVFTTLAIPADAGVILDRSAEAVILENSLVRVELRKDANFQPTVLMDKRNSAASCIDDVGYSGWDVACADWMTSAISDWEVRIRTHRTEEMVWCETTLVKETSGTMPSRLALRTTVRGNSPAVRFDFQATFQPEHVHTLGLRIQMTGYKRAEWKTPWGESTLELVGRKNRFHPLLGFVNGIAFAGKSGEPRGGLLLLHNTAWSNVFPTLREKPTFARYKHPTLTSPARCSITLLPFADSAALAAQMDTFGRPTGVALPGAQSRPVSARPQRHRVPSREDRKRGLIAFPVAPFTTVLPDTQPPQESVGTALRMRACAGEFEPASFAVRALEPLRGVSVKTSNLICGDSMIPAEAIETHVVKVWRQAGPPAVADATLGAGQIVPELLVKNDLVELAGSRPEVRLTGPVETSIAAAHTKQFWLTVRVPQKLTAGRYRGHVTVTVRERAPTLIPFEVEVLPFTLAPSRKKQGIWFKAERRPTQREYVEPEIYRKLLNDVRSHGIQFVTIRGRGMSIAEDALQIHHAAGMGGMAIWSSWFPSSVSEFGPLREALETLAKKNGYDRLYFQASDEPNNDELIVRALDHFTKIKAAGGRTFCNIMPEYALRLGEQLDVPCVGYANFFGSLERPEPVSKTSSQALTRLLRTHDDVWYYWQCRVEDPRINRLLFGFLLMKSPATGAMPYTYSTLEVEQPFDDWSALQQGQVSRAGGGAVYHTRNGTLSTIQWEAAREGIDDARYVSTLESLIDKASLKPQLANQTTQARKVLAAVYGRLPSHLYKTVNEVSPEVLDTMRSQIIAAILKLRGALID